MAPGLSHRRGAQAETLAAQYLAHHGVRILTRNFRCRLGEIDLIGLDAETLCFIEVRHRAEARFGAPLETVSALKRRRITRTAEYFLVTQWRGPSCACRFDVVAIEGTSPARITQIRGAFEFEGRLWP